MKKIVCFTIATMLLTACGSRSSIAVNDNDNRSTNPFIGTIETTDALALDNSDYDSFEAAVIGADTANDTENKTTITLSGTAVLNNINAYYSRPNIVAPLSKSSSDIAISIITDPVISLDFNEYGYFTSTKLYVGDKTYTADEPSTEYDSIRFFQSFSDPDDDDTVIAVNRNFQHRSRTDRIWDFVSKYMVNVVWETGKQDHASDALTDKDIYYDGYMVAGFETAGADIDTTGEISFHGSGQGYQTTNVDYSPDAARALSFSVIADVNFADRTVGLQTIDTYHCFFGRCTPMFGLNFATILNYDAGKNNISGSVEADGMRGTAEARFYGIDDNAAQELGGTFAMRNGDNRYVGLFGVMRTNILNLTANVDDIPNISNAGYTSLDTASTDANLNKPLILSALAVQETTEQFYNRPNRTNQTNNNNTNDTDDTSGPGNTNIDDINGPGDANDTGDDPDDTDMLPDWYASTGYLVGGFSTIATINNSALSISFNGNGDIAGTELYVGGESYSATLRGAGSDVSFSENFENLGDNISGNIAIDRNFNDGTNNYFNFTAQYMLSINWNFDDNSFSANKTTSTNNDYKGYLIAGMETDGAHIPSEETLEFSGNGFGYYREASDNDTTKFNVIADIDFSGRTINLRTLSTTSSTDCSFGRCTSLSQFNFTNILNYDANTNNISGAIEADGMVGTAQARFYGIGDDAASELGGTFIMRNGINAYYYGYFGASRAHIIESFDDFSAIAKGEADRELEFSSIAVQASITADLNRPETHMGTSWIYNTLLNEIKFKNVVIEETAASNPRIDITYSLGDYEKDGQTITDGLLDKVEVKLGNQTYMLDDGGLDEATESLRKGMLIDDDAFDVGYMEVNRGQEFGFESKYMVSARWGLISDITWVGGDDENVNDITYQKERTEGSAKFTSGFLVSGFETGDNILNRRGVITTDTFLPVKGEAEFTGKGVGYYHSNLFQLIEFDVTAHVIFTNRTVGIKTKNTMGYVCETLATTCDDAIRTSLPELNFDKSDLTYESDDNDISGDLTIDGMTGDIDARFYGPETEEFGGTFQVNDDERNYMGMFGAQKTAP